MSLKNKAFSGIKFSSIATILSTVFQTAQLIILARLLEINDFGLMGMVAIVIRFTDLIKDLSISDAIIQKKEVTKQDLSSLYWFNIFLGFFLAIVLFICSPLIANLFNEPQLTNLIRLSALMFVISPFSQLFRAIIIKNLDFALTARIEVVANLAGALVTIILAFLKFGILSMIIGQIVIVSLNSVLFFIKGIKLFKPTFHYSFKEVKKYLRFGMFKTGETIINYFNLNIDTMAIGKVLGTKALGVYNIAFNIIIIPSTRINPIINRVLFPIFSLMQDQEGMKKNFYKLLTVVGLINYPLFIGLIVTAPELILVMFGEKWRESIPLLQIMSGVGLLRALDNPIGPLLMARDKVDLIFKLNLLKLSLQIPCIIVAAYFYGTIGVAVTFLILQIGYNLLGYLYLIRSAIGSSFAAYVKAISIPLFLTSPMAIAVLIFKLIAPPLSIYWMLGLSITIGFLFYFILLLLSKNEIVKEVRNLILDKLPIRK